jgi:hypothetical protein
MFTAWFKILTPFFSPIFNALKSFAMGIFIYRAGKKDAQLDNLKEENKNVSKAAKIKSNIDQLPDDELIGMLKSSRAVKPKKP